MRARKRIATRLVTEAEAAARKDGVRRLSTAASITARPLFERHGFRVLSPQTVQVRGEAFPNFQIKKMIHFSERPLVTSPQRE